MPQYVRCWGWTGLFAEMAKMALLIRCGPSGVINLTLTHDGSCHLAGTLNEPIHHRA
jgi:hypothetical protein